MLEDVDENDLSPEELKERTILALLLKVRRTVLAGWLACLLLAYQECDCDCACACEQVKNGTPPQRKTALRQLTNEARKFGAGPLFNQILPLLMSPTLEDQERHLLVKVS